MLLLGNMFLAQEKDTLQFQKSTFEYQYKKMYIPVGLMITGVIAEVMVKILGTIKLLRLVVGIFQILKITPMIICSLHLLSLLMVLNSQE